MNKEIKMNNEILSIIITTLRYKDFIYSYYKTILKEMDYDIYKETEKFYYSLPLPNGMKANISDFETVLSYSDGYGKKLLDEMRSTEYNNLDKFVWKNY